MTVVGRDARQNEIAGLTNVSFSSDNPTTVIVTPSGIATTVFQFPQTLKATVTATATKDGVTVSGSTAVTVLQPSSFDFAALLLSDYEQPSPVPTRGAGIAYFFRDGPRLFYRVTWSALSGPATSASIHGPASYAEVAPMIVELPLSSQMTNYGTIVGTLAADDIRGQGGRPAISMDSLVTLLGSRNAYLEVRTAAYPNGEIRGQGFKF
jgi:hypothetical protein